MKDDQEWLSKVREVLVSGIDDKSHAHTLSDAMQQACEEYAEVMNTQITAELAERDRRVVELSKEVQRQANILHWLQIGDCMTNAEFEHLKFAAGENEDIEHPLLVKGEES